MNEVMQVLPSGPHSAQQLSKVDEVYGERKGFLLKRSGGKTAGASPRMSPKGIGKSFSFGQLS